MGLSDEHTNIHELSEHSSVQGTVENDQAALQNDFDELPRQIDSYSLDVKAIDKEFRCPFINNEKNTQTNLTQKHIIQDPVITSCCGTSVCLKCVVDKILHNNQIIGELESGPAGSVKVFKCCFCQKPI